MLLTFPVWVERAVLRLEREAPFAATAMCEALGELTVLIDVEGERAMLSAASGRCALLPSAPAAFAVELCTTRRAIAALARGELSILDAITSGGVTLRGPVAALAGVYDALIAFLEGAVRAPSFADTLDQFLRWQRLRDRHVARGTA